MHLLLLLTTCVCLAHSRPNYPFYGGYPNYYNPYVGNYGYPRPNYLPTYNPYNINVGNTEVIDVDQNTAAAAAGDLDTQNWLRNYWAQVDQQAAQEKSTVKPEEPKRGNDQQGAQLQGQVQLQQQQQWPYWPFTTPEKSAVQLEVATIQPVSEMDSAGGQQIIRMADGRGYILKQVGQSYHESITSKPIVHTYTESKPIVSHIHRVFTGDESQPVVKVFYNGRDITDDQTAIDAVHSGRQPADVTDGPVTAASTAAPEPDSDASDASDEVEDEDDNSGPKPITSWFG